MNRNDENYVYMLVSRNLKKIRKTKHLTQSQLAQLCNYSEGFIMNIESQKYHQTFSLGTIWNIAEKLKIDIRELFEPLEKNE